MLGGNLDITALFLTSTLSPMDRSIAVEIHIEKLTPRLTFTCCKLVSMESTSPRHAVSSGDSDLNLNSLFIVAIITPTT